MSKQIWRLTATDDVKEKTKLQDVREAALQGGMFIRIIDI